VVASVAAHGLVFASLGLFPSGDPAIQAGMNDAALVTVELIADGPEVLPQFVEQSVMQKVEVQAKPVQRLQAVAHITVPQAEETLHAQNEHVDSSRLANSSAKTPSRKSSGQFTSLIRQHLESFKYYPASARRRGIEGEVDVAFKLAMSGHADEVSIIHGSGYAVLDRAALDTVQRAQPFPVDEGRYRFRLRFNRL